LRNLVYGDFHYQSRGPLTLMNIDNSFTLSSLHAFADRKNNMIYSLLPD
jgi:hypothetical protein